MWIAFFRALVLIAASMCVLFVILAVIFAIVSRNEVDRKNFMNAYFNRKDDSND